MIRFGAIAWLALAPAFASPVTDLTAPVGPGSTVPNLSAAADGVWLSWIEKRAGKTELLLARFDGGGWTEPQVVASSRNFMVNWADFPSLLALGKESLVAHWLEKHSAQEHSYDYDVLLSSSIDAGKTWSAPFSPHKDNTASEHGFVSLVAGSAGSYGLLWLDGRAKAADKKAMQALWFAESDGAFLKPESLVDDSVCDCCQTAAAAIPGGLIAFYRNRTPEEIRDVYYVRRVHGVWSKPRPLHEDGWKMPGCPVNGPAAASEGNLVVAAWFTAAGEKSAVALKFSSDGGESFGPRIRVDRGNPVGRVSVRLLEDGSAVVGWLEAGKLWLRRVRQDGRLGEPLLVSSSGNARKSGFLRLATFQGNLLAAWTDVAGDRSRVRVALIDPRSVWNN